MKRDNCRRMSCASIVGVLPTAGMSVISGVVMRPSGLTCTRAYSDIDDRERFEGAGETVTIPAGGVAVVEIDEAYRVVADVADSRVVVLHVTVEGYSFPNK